MRHTSIWIACTALLVASCGGSDDNSSGGTAAPTDPPSTEPVATDPPSTDPPSTDPPATDPPATDPPPTDPPPTDPPATTTTEPPPPINVVGLVPLPGVQLDFSASAASNPSLVWSLFSGSGGIIVENVGGPLPPGCHGVSFFDPQTFELLQIGGTDAEAYATIGPGGCDGMQQDPGEGVIDGAAVKVNADNVIIFDFGELPAPPFEVSTQVLNPSGGDGVFRSANPNAPMVVNDLAGADYIIGSDVLLEVVDNDFVVRDTPAPPDGRFGTELLNGEGSPGSVVIAGDDSDLFSFSEPSSWEVLVRVINGCAINNHFWVFAAATTDIEYKLTVTDTSSGEIRSYTNPLGNFSEPIVDTQAFATCP